MTIGSPAEYFQQHSALADWLRAVSPTDRDSILTEDSTRSARLAFLAEVIDLPIVNAITFAGNEVDPTSPRLTQFVKSARGPYALRAFKVDNRDQVFRNRNLPVEQLMDWLDGLHLDLAQYELEFSQHLPNEWATIFVVTETGILGELVRGSLRQLTQGGHSGGSFVSFTYDLTDWWVDSADPHWRELAELMLHYITVFDAERRRPQRPTHVARPVQRHQFHNQYRSPCQDNIVGRSSLVNTATSRTGMSWRSIGIGVHETLLSI
jgi:hypothetical protein